MGIPLGFGALYECRHLGQSRIQVTLKGTEDWVTIRGLDTDHSTTTLEKYYNLQLVAWLPRLI
ncbi:unnamed protein product, partial [marine sediment metagenome]